MRERLLAAIHSLERNGWKADRPLLVILRRIAEKEPDDVIEDLFEAFR
jgi:hypothetical protein